MDKRLVAQRHIIKASIATPASLFSHTYPEKAKSVPHFDHKQQLRMLLFKVNHLQQSLAGIRAEACCALEQAMQSCLFFSFPFLFLPVAPC